MNCSTHTLPEIEISQFCVRESLQMLLHTILFLRAPGPIAPCDVQTEHLSFSYSKIGKCEDVDKQIDEAANRLFAELVPIGPELAKGCVTLSFFERRVSKVFLGLVSTEERVVWEVWNIPLLVNSTPRPVNDDSASIIERQRIQSNTEDTLRQCMVRIFAAAADISNVPPVMYEFSVSAVKKGSKLEEEERENVYARVANMPALINLSH
jgi:autophagy-related protein 101